MTESKKYTILILIILFGLILRVLYSNVLTVSADDMLMAEHAINIINSGQLEPYHQSAPLWFYLTDFFYKIGGVSQLTSRLSAIIFGTLTVILIYFFTFYLFKSKRTSLIAALLAATEPIALHAMKAEMDTTIVFFLLANLYFLYRGIKEDSTKLLYLSSLCLGIAFLIKIYTALFIGVNIIYLLYFYYKKNKLTINKEQIKVYVVMFLILFIFLIPTLAHNYILYKEKGILDLQFTRVFGLGKEKSAQFYSWDAQFNAKFSDRIGPAIPDMFKNILYLIQITPIIFLLGLFGCYLLYKKEKRLIFLFALSMIIPFIYFTAIINLPKHFLIIFMLLTIPAAYVINKFLSKNILYGLAAIVIGLSLFYNINLFHQEPTSKLINFKNQNIDQNSFVLVDSRIYRGDMHWLFHDKNYIEASIFHQAHPQRPQNETIPVKTYFIECATGDCGWGSVKKGDQLDLLMESYVSLFSEQGTFREEYNIWKPGDYGNKPVPYYKIYEAVIQVHPAIFQIAKQQRTWFLYPVGWDAEEWFDKLHPKGFFDSILYNLARAVIFLSILLAFILPLYIFYKEIKHDNHHSSSIQRGENHQENSQEA